MVSFGTLVKHVHKLELVPCSTVGPTEVKILTFLNLFLGFHIFFILNMQIYINNTMY